MNSDISKYFICQVLERNKKNIDFYVFQFALKRKNRKSLNACKCFQQQILPKYFVLQMNRHKLCCLIGYEAISIEIFMSYYDTKPACMLWPGACG
ncbi:MAG: hypothetical protein CL674_10485 [Bdellovibrionaceae bacterium]|nr:hypothetical protein [Pseudobdellovibrionaceae bacterium]